MSNFSANRNDPTIHLSTPLLRHALGLPLHPQMIPELVRKLNHYSKSYHSLGVSLVSDYEYDALYQQLAQLKRTPNTPYPTALRSAWGSL